MSSIAIGSPSMIDWFIVRLNGKEIDRVSFMRREKMTAELVRQSLVNHDGYDPAIKVVKER